MNRIMLIHGAAVLAAFFATQMHVAAQATIGFANGASSAITNGLTHQRVPVGSSFRVVLFSAPLGQPEAAFTQIAGPIGITGSPGLFNGGNVVVPGLIAGQSAQFQVRVWDSTTAATWGAAASNSSVMKSKSSVVTAATGTSLASSGLKIPPTTSDDCLIIICPTGTITALPGCEGSAVVNFTIIASNLCTGTAAPYSCSHSPGGNFTNATVTLVTCTAMDTNGNSASCSFTIQVASPITAFSLVPQNKLASSGGNATFSVSASNALPLSYRWLRDGALLPGATNASYTVTSAKSGDEGTYTVELADPCGEITLKSATLTVLNDPVDDAYIPAGAFWNYRFDGTDPGTNWPERSFNDTAWPGGRAQLGFGDGDEATVIGHNTNGFITAYFRRPFVLSSPASGTNLLLALKRDDGAIVYVNGVEIFRSNMPTGAVTHLTLAPQFDPADGAGFHVAPVPSGVAVAGTNLLAVEVHQSGIASSDLSFDLQLVRTAALANARLGATRSGPAVVLSWSNALFRLQTTTQLGSVSPNAGWTNLAGRSPVTNFPSGPLRAFRLVWP